MRMLKVWLHRFFHHNYELSYEAEANKPHDPILKLVTQAGSNPVTATSQEKQFNGVHTTAAVFDGTDDQFSDYVDACFFNWIAGEQRAELQQNRAFERQLIDYLDTLAASELAGSNLIARVPSVMVQLLKRMHEENVSSSELSRLIAKDVVIVAAILGEVNSSFYNYSEKISDLSQAILLLGHNRLRMVLAKVSFTPVFNAQLSALSTITASKIWEHSQKRALTAYLLAKHQHIDPFMGFLAGLMQDVGLMVALRVFDRSNGATSLPTSTVFRETLKRKTIILSTRIGYTWSLPEAVIKSIQGQSSEDTNLTKMPITKLLKRADLLSKICTLMTAGQLPVDVERIRAMLTDAEADCLFTLLEGNASIATIF